MINLGDKVKDNISGLVGIVVAKTEWLNGCRRIAVQPNVVKDGKPVEASTFDVEDLELLEANALKRKPKEKFTNGPMPDTPRR